MVFGMRGQGEPPATSSAFSFQIHPPDASGTARPDAARTATPLPAVLGTDRRGTQHYLLSTGLHGSAGAAGERVPAGVEEANT